MIENLLIDGMRKTLKEEVDLVNPLFVKVIFFSSNR